MALTSASVIYDVATAQVRSIIVPEDDSELNSHVAVLLPGERLTKMSLVGLPTMYRSNLDRAKAAVLLATGRVPIES